MYLIHRLTRIKADVLHVTMGASLVVAVRRKRVYAREVAQHRFYLFRDYRIATKFIKVRRSVFGDSVQSEKFPPFTFGSIT